MSLRIKLQGFELLDLAPAINAATIPLLNQAVRAVSAKVASTWQEEVQRAKLWSGEKDAYAQSITWEMTGDFSAEVRATYKYAQEIDTGRPARDLKRMLQTSEKVRYSKKGKRYLIIPFRHNVPGKRAHAQAMPQEIYKQARVLSPSVITGKQLQHNGGVGPLGKKVLRNTYNWGDRLVSDQRKYNGMVRFNTGIGAGAKSSEYLTFRVMSESSSGWVVPPKPGLFLTRKVVDTVRPKATAAFQAAIAQTLKSLK